MTRDNKGNEINQSYLGIRYNDDGSVKSVSICPNLDEAKKWLTNSDDADPEVHENGSEEEDKDPYITTFNEILSRLTSVVEQQRRIMNINAILSVVGNVSIEQGLTVLYNDRNAADEHGNAKIFEINEKENIEATKQIKRSRDFDQASEEWPGAVLMLLVATFDSLISDILEKSLRFRNTREVFVDRTLTARQIFSASSFEELKSSIIQDELYDLLWKNRSEQADYISSKLHINIKSNWSKWAQYLEVFERRNLVAHGEKVFTSRYVEKCNKNGSKNFAGKEGDRISIGFSYLSDSFDVTIEFLILLTFMLWTKGNKEIESEAFLSMNNLCYVLIKKKRYNLSASISRFLLTLKKMNCNERTRRMLAVNLANALKESNHGEESAEELKKFDWSACSDDFKISIAAIEERDDDVLNLMDKVKDKSLVGPIGFRDWPVFRSMRKKEAFCRKFEEIFGEPLSIEHREITPREEPLKIDQGIEIDEQSEHSRAVVTRH